MRNPILSILLIAALMTPALSLATEADTTQPSNQEVFVDSLPRITFYQQPTYSRRARKAGYQGVIWVQVQIDVSGKVTNPEVLQSCGHKSLDQEALKAASKCEFSAAVDSRCPFATWVTYLVPFGDRFDHIEPGKIVFVGNIAKTESDIDSYVSRLVNTPKPNSTITLVIPEMIHYEVPDYPLLVEIAKMEGFVEIRALVGSDGLVQQADVYRSSGLPSLDNAALAVSPRCRFRPALASGIPIAFWVTYKVDFILE